MNALNIRALLSSLLLTALLAGCGLKGELYLPEDASETTAEESVTVEASNTAENTPDADLTIVDPKEEEQTKQP